MTGETVLRDLIVVLAAALPIVLVGHRLKIPTVVGFLVAGMLIGPYGVGIVPSAASVESLAELSIVLLLFVVGLELSFSQLAELGWKLVAVGSLQIVLSVLMFAGLGLVAGMESSRALFLGFLLAHSSTAIVLKLLSDRGEIDAPHGRVVVGILLIQDFSLVPMVLMTRLLATPDADLTLVVTALAKAALAFAVIALAARLIIPALLRAIVSFRNRELFTGAVVLFCLGTAWLAAQFGLSLAVGALIAGLVVSESEYSHQVFAEVLPFRDVLNGIFFVSVGMLVHLNLLASDLPIWILAAGTILLLKFTVVAVLARLAFGSQRISVMSAASLAATGEMSFVLAGVGLPLGLMARERYESFVGVAVVTMIAAPFLLTAGPTLASWVHSWLGDAEPAENDTSSPPMSNHVVVVGYGLNGENLARVLRETSLPHIVLELHPDRLAAARSQGEQALFGDATRIDVLRQASVEAAAVVVVAISDPAATRRIVALARQLAPRLPIVVRTRYVAEIEGLHRLGATEVIPEEMETSVEIFARVLRLLHVPRNVIHLQIDLIRREGYGMLRGVSLPSQPLTHLDQILAATLTETVLITPTSPAADRTIRDLALRKTTGVTIIAVVRMGRPFTNPEPDFLIAPDDVLVLVGSHAQLENALQALEGSEGN